MISHTSKLIDEQDKINQEKFINFANQGSSTRKNIRDHIDEYVAFKQSITLRTSDLKEACEEQLKKLFNLEKDVKNKINTLEESIQDVKARNVKKVDLLQHQIDTLMQSGLSQSKTTTEVHNRIDKQDDSILLQRNITTQLKTQIDDQASMMREQHETNKEAIAHLHVLISNQSALSVTQEKEHNDIILGLKAQIEDQSRLIRTQNESHKDIAIEFENRIKSQFEVAYVQAENYNKSVGRLQNQLDSQSETIITLTETVSQLQNQVRQQFEKAIPHEETNQGVVTELKAQLEHHAKLMESQKQTIDLLKDQIENQNKKIDSLSEIFEGSKQSITTLSELSKRESVKTGEQISKKLQELDATLATTREELDKNVKLTIDFCKDYQNEKSDLKSQLRLMDDGFCTRLEKFEKNYPVLNSAVKIIDVHIDQLLKNNNDITTEQADLRTSMDTMKKLNEDALKKVSQKLQTSIDEVSEKVESNRQQIETNGHSTSNLLADVAHDLTCTKEFASFVNDKCTKVESDVDKLHVEICKSVKVMDQLVNLSDQVSAHENTLTTILDWTKTQNESLSEVFAQIKNISAFQKDLSNTQNDMSSQIELNTLKQEQKAKVVIEEKLKSIETDIQEKTKDDIKVLCDEIKKENFTYIEDKIALLGDDIRKNTNDFLDEKLKLINIDLETKSNSFVMNGIDKITLETQNDFEALIHDHMDSFRHEIETRLSISIDEKIKSLANEISSETTISIKEQMCSVGSEIQTRNNLSIGEKLLSAKLELEETAKALINNEITSLYSKTTEKLDLLGSHLENTLSASIEEKTLGFDEIARNMTLAIEEKINTLQNDIQTYAMKFLNEKIAITIPDIQTSSKTCIKTEMDSLLLKVREASFLLIDDKMSMLDSNTENQINTQIDSLESKISCSIKEEMRSLVFTIEENITKNFAKEMSLIESSINENSENTLNKKVDKLSSSLEKKFHVINKENLELVTSEIEKKVGKSITESQDCIDAKIKEKLELQLDGKFEPLEKTIKTIDEKQHQLDEASSKLQHNVIKNIEKIDSIIETQCTDRINSEKELVRADTLMNNNQKEIEALKELINLLKKEPPRKDLDNIMKYIDDKGIEIISRVENLEHAFENIDLETEQLVHKAISTIKQDESIIDCLISDKIKNELAERHNEYDNQIKLFKENQYFEYNARISFLIFEQIIQAILEKIPELQSRYSCLLSDFIKNIREDFEEDNGDCEEETNGIENIQDEFKSFSRFYGTQDFKHEGGPNISLQESPSGSRFNLYDADKKYETKFYDTENFVSTPKRQSSLSSVVYHAKDYDESAKNKSNVHSEGINNHLFTHSKIIKKSDGGLRRPSSEGCSQSYYYSNEDIPAVNYLDLAQKQSKVNTFSTDSWEDTSPKMTSGGVPLALSSQQYINNHMAKSVYNRPLNSLPQPGKYLDNRPSSIDQGATYYASQQSRNRFNQSEFSDQFETPECTTFQTYRASKSFVPVDTSATQENAFYSTGQYSCAPIAVSNSLSQLASFPRVNNRDFTESDYSGYVDDSVTENGSTTLQRL